MSGEWRASTWGEEISLEYGKALRGYDATRGKFRVFGSNGPIGWTDTSLAPGPGVILGRKGAYRGIEFSRDPFFVIDTAYYVVPKSELDMRWLYYAIKYHKLGEIDDGSPIPSTTRSAVYVRDLDVPPVAEQKAIAAVLGALDDKIDLNRRMNAKLEAMARALFQSWFVDFEPVRAKLDGRQPPGLAPATAALFPNEFQDSELGRIPKDWRVGAIGGVAEVIDCLHSRKPARTETGRLFLQLNNIRDDGLLDLTDAFLISDEDYANWISRMEARSGDCVITNVGRVGAVSQIPEGVRAALGRNMTGIRCKSDFACPTFLLQCLLSDAMKEEIGLKIDSGTILDALNVRSIPFLRFVQPPTNLAMSFERVVRPMRKAMEANLQQSHTLAAIRDALLPPLLRGTIKVPTHETRHD
jgi:type I restriction enzyme, S subunit